MQSDVGRALVGALLPRSKMPLIVSVLPALCAEDTRSLSPTPTPRSLASSVPTRMSLVVSRRRAGDDLLGQRHDAEVVPRARRRPARSRGSSPRARPAPTPQRWARRPSLPASRGPGPRSPATGRSISRRCSGGCTIAPSVARHPPRRAGASLPLGGSSCRCGLRGQHAAHEVRLHAGEQRRHEERSPRPRWPHRRR